MPSRKERVEMPLLRPNWPCLALAVAAALLILPLWLADAPAMPDYPARLAGFYLIHGGAQTSPLSGFYSIAWAPLPNLAGEIAVPLLAHLMPLETAARFFLSVALAMWVAGPALIHHALYGRIGLAPLAAAFFAYNVNFLWGFFNYCFAIGLCLIVFAGWIASKDWARTPRLALFAAAAIVLYFCHILGAALFLMLVATYEAGRRPIDWRHLFLDVSVISVPVGILYLFKPGSLADGGVEFDLIDTFVHRIESIVQWHFGTPAYLLLGVLALLFVVGLWRRKITLHPQMRLTLIATASLALLAPETAMGGWGLHLRFPAVAATLLFAASEISLSRRLAVAAATAILATLAGMSAVLADQWRAFDGQIAEFRASLRELPRGSHLMAAVDTRDDGRVPNQIYWHFTEFAIIDRSIFTSLMFTTRGQHIIRLAPAVDGFAASAARGGSPPKLNLLDSLATGHVKNPKIRHELRYLLRFPCHYDEVLLIHANGKSRAVPGMLSLRHAGSFFSLYDVRPPAGCSVISATRP